MSGVLVDNWSRQIRYVRISVTDRCNYRCRYCMPQEGIEWVPHERILSYEDIAFFIEILSTFGIRKIRFTGGEPLVRKGLLSFMEKTHFTFPDMRLHLTTNGSALHEHVSLLRRSGLTGINISLDTLDPGKFTFITGTNLLGKVLAGLDALISLKVDSIKMNVVLIKGFNDNEIESLVLFAREMGIILRFIEFMPLDRKVWARENFMSYREALSKLPEPKMWSREHSETDELAGPARYYVHRVSGQKVGFISAVSRHFCPSCNRLRLTSFGELRSCLFCDDVVSVFEALRARDCEGVREGIAEALRRKPRAGVTLKNDGERCMFKIGG